MYICEYIYIYIYIYVYIHIYSIEEDMSMIKKLLAMIRTAPLWG